jgi:hypothetical protein
MCSCYNTINKDFDICGYDGKAPPSNNLYCWSLILCIYEECELPKSTACQSTSVALVAFEGPVSHYLETPPFACYACPMVLLQIKKE